MTFKTKFYSIESLYDYFKNKNHYYPMINSFLSRFRKFLFVTLVFIFFSTDVFSQRYEMVWSDEFDQEVFNEEAWFQWDGTAYNNEQQYYTPRDTNIHIKDGYLYLVGLREKFEDQNWTSGRIETRENFQFQYGKVEIRAKLPAAKGMWPAFWMLGSNRFEIGWPYTGEIDIMEFKGHQKSRTQGTVHFSAVRKLDGSHAMGDHRKLGEEFFMPEGNLTEDFHIYEFEWSESKMSWFLDGVKFYELTREEIEARSSFYPFDQPFYLILNLAIGGDYLRDMQPDSTTPDRNEVIVDYVRVYQVK